MKRTCFTIVILCSCLLAFAAEQRTTSGLIGKAPAVEIAELEDLIAKAKASGQTPDPAWTIRIRELIPMVKGHASKVPADLHSFQVDGGFAPGAVIRPTELTPLEAQIRELEFQLSGGLTFQGVDEITFANLKEQLNELYAQRPANRERNPLDQGSETCPGTVVPGVPYTDSGTTFGFANDYNPINDCAFSIANEVVYVFTPQVTQTYNISLQGSSYDTYLFVNTDGGCPGTTQVACNDDWFGLQSFVSVVLNGGQTYYIFVDGFNINSGDYVLNITDNCDVVCQPGDVQECAETPGPGFEGTDCNGSCQNLDFSGTDSWQDIAPFQTVCGRGFTYLTNFGSSFRDVDTYRFTITEPCSLALTINAEFASQMLIVSGSCPYNFLAGFYTWQYSCSTATFVTPCFQPGSYALIVLPATQEGLNVPRDYRARVDLIPCNGCVVDAYLPAPGSAGWHTCGAGNDNSFRPSEDYTFAVNIPHDGEWTFSTCNDDSIWDSYIYLSTACNSGIITLDDDACGGIGLSVIPCVPLTAGTYYLTVEGWSQSGCGPFVLNVFECEGSCCYGTPADPTCEYVGQNECNSLGGTWTNLEPCSTGACYTRPDCGDGEITFSQVPSLPDEPWNAQQSDLNAAYVQYENYSVSAAIGSIRFWGAFVEGGSCNTDPQSFEITFIDSVNNVTQTYNVTLTATVLPLVYFGTYPLVEYTAELNPPCTITNGWVRVAESASASCTFHWSWTILGNGQPAHESFFGGAPYQTSWELAFCLDQAPCVIDSVTLLWDSPGNATLRWYQNLPGEVNFWYTTDPNAVYPAGFVSAGTIAYPAGNNAVGVNANFSDYLGFVLVLDCTPPAGAALQAPPRVLNLIIDDHE